MATNRCPHPHSVAWLEVDVATAEVRAASVDTSSVSNPMSGELADLFCQLNDHLVVVPPVVTRLVGQD